MKAKQPARSLRDQITTYLARHTEATAKTIAAHTSERDFPSRVLNELNRMRTDALVECEKRKGKGNEYYYWLVARPAPIATQTGETPQPEVGENTGSDGSAVSVPDASTEAVAVHEPAPATAAATAAPVKGDETESEGGEADIVRTIVDRVKANADELDPSIARAAARVERDREYQGLQTIIADIRAAIGDSGQLMLDELAPRIRQVQADAQELHAARKVLGQHDTLLAEIAALEQKRLETTAALTGAMKDLDTVHEILAPFSGDLDPSDLTEIQLAEIAAKAIRATLDTAETMATGDDAVDVIDAATGYLVRVPKRRPRIITKPQSAREAALAAARNGAGRADVFALVHVGSARRGAEWKEPQ